MTDHRELKPCPCGKTPTKISVGDAGQGGKWAWAIPDCCGEWNIEFRTDYKPLDSDECKESAVFAWNHAPRGEALSPAQEALPGDDGTIEMVSEILYDYADLLEAGVIDGARRYYPEAVREAAEALRTRLKQGQDQEAYSDVLRALASYVSAGGYNAPDPLDPKEFEEKIKWGIDNLVANKPTPSPDRVPEALLAEAQDVYQRACKYSHHFNKDLLIKTLGKVLAAHTEAKGGES